MKRRKIVGLAACTAFLPFIARAQSKRVYRIAMVGINPTTPHLRAAFEQGLREHGRMPGRDIVLEMRSAESDPSRYPGVVSEVVRSKPDVIVTTINANTLPVKAATQRIPIVMAIGTEVISAGLVRDFAKPAGNVTGLTWDVGPESAAKRMELLKEIAPATARVGILWEAPYGDEYLQTTRDAADVLRLRSFGLEFTGDMERDFSELRRRGADAVYVHHGGQLFLRRSDLAAAAIRHRLPSACGAAEVVDAGALMSYGPSLPDLLRRAAGYVDKILKGANPAELPVERPAKLELVVNRSTARALGLALAPSFLLRVDRTVT